MAAYHCDFCGSVTPHEPFSFYEWQKVQAESAMERGGTEACKVMGLWKLADIGVRLFDADQYQCQGCASLVQPKRSLEHYFYIPEGISKQGRGKRILGYEGFFYLDDISNDPECLQYLRRKYDPNFLSNRIR